MSEMVLFENEKRNTPTPTHPPTHPPQKQPHGPLHALPAQPGGLQVQVLLRRVEPQVREVLPRRHALEEDAVRRALLLLVVCVRCWSGGIG